MSYKSYHKNLSGDLIHHNLGLLHEANQDGLHKSKFQKENGSQLLDTNYLLAYLLKQDLIETEVLPDIYYLTPEGFDAYETAEYLTFEESDYYSERTLSYNQVLSEEEAAKRLMNKKRDGREEKLASKWFQVKIVMILVAAGTFWLKECRESKELDFTELMEIIEQKEQGIIELE